MAYKTIEQYLSFADLVIISNAAKNRTYRFLRELDEAIDWDPIQDLLKKHYKTGKSEEGERAYQPLLLFKCLLLQKWFQIKSDPELESQINDRISFRAFLRLSMDYPSPDHSTFSRFRSRLPKKAMVEINNALLLQFHQQGVTINKGVAVDARLIKSASKPIPNVTIDELREKQNAPESKFDKKGNPKKFTRDLESDWTVKNDIPHYGIKEHASVDTQNGFVLCTYVTPASHNDSIYLPLVVTGSMHTPEKINKVYADKGYFGEPNRSFLTLNAIKDGIMRKDTVNAKLTETEINRNKILSKSRYVIEQYFGISCLYDEGSRARFPRIVTNAMDLMFRQFAYNLRKGSKILSPMMG
jgi:IS5 family transposase